MYGFIFSLVMEAPNITDARADDFGFWQDNVVLPHSAIVHFVSYVKMFIFSAFHILEGRMPSIFVLI